MSDIQYETFEPEYKGDDRVTRIGGADDKPLSKQLGSIRMEQSPAGSVYYRLDASGNVPQVRELLERAGYPIDNNDIRNGSILLRRAPVDPATIEPGKPIRETRLLDSNDLSQLLRTLSTDIDLGRGEMVYGVLDKNTVGQIIDRDMTVRGITPSQAGLVKIETPEYDVARYGDNAIRGTVEAEIPDGAVAALREDAAFAALPDRNVSEVSTRIELRDPYAANAVKGSLEKADLRVDVHRGDDVVNVVEGRADNAKLEAVLNERGIEFRHQPNSSTWKFNSPEDADVASALMRKAQPEIKFDVPTPEVSVTAKSATVDEVATALGKSGHLQSSVASEIADTAREIHPEQSAINAAVRDANTKLVNGPDAVKVQPEVKQPNTALEEMRYRLEAQGRGRNAMDKGNRSFGRMGVDFPPRNLHAPLPPITPKTDAPTLQQQLEKAISEAPRNGPTIVPQDVPADEIEASRQMYEEDKKFGRTGVQKPAKVQRMEDLLQVARWQQSQPGPEIPEKLAPVANGNAMPNVETPNALHMPDAPHMPHKPRIAPKVGGAGAVLAAGITAGFARADQRDGESFGHAFERTVEGSLASLFDPIASVKQGDYGMAAAQVFDNTGVAVSARVSEYRISEAARSVTAEQKAALEPALPKGNMNLGSSNSRLNLIAKLLAYRDQGVQNLTVGDSLFSAEPQIYGPGEPGMIMAEGTRVSSTEGMLDEQIRNFIAEGGNMQSIREALDKDYFKEQNYLRLRSVVPDPKSPGYEHHAIEARDGMQQLEAFRTLIQSGADIKTPEARAQAIDLAYDYLMAQDFDENRMLRNANYQFSRMEFPIARPEDLIAAGMGPLFNITGKPENLRDDMQNIMKVLSQPSGGPEGEQIFARVNPGRDMVAQPADIYAALTPALQAQVNAEQVRLASLAPTPAPAAAPVAAAPAPETPTEPEPAEIVVSAERYKDAPSSMALSQKQNKLIEDSGLKAFIDRDGDGMLELGELRAALRNAGVTIADSGKVSDKQLTQALPQLLAARDDQTRSVKG